MKVHRVASLDDPRVAHYRNVKDRLLERQGKLFIAEGEHLLRRLLDSDFEVESVLLADRREAELAPLVGERAPVYVVPQALMNEIAGVKFHSGVLACGRRKARTTIDDVVPREAAKLTLLIWPEIANVDNVGSLIRLAAGFGVDAMILGERCHDPFWRQSIRVSMGAIFKLPLVHTDDLHRDLDRLRAEWGVELIATVLDPSAEALATAKRGRRVGLLLGNEAQGLDERSIAACGRRVTIPMHYGTDSLNVAVAAGIFLYHFTTVAAV